MVIKVNPINRWETEFEKGSSFSKCQKCGCMIGALEEMKAVLSSAGDRESVKLMKKVESWLGRMQSSLYT